MKRSALVFCVVALCATACSAAKPRAGAKEVLEQALFAAGTPIVGQVSAASSVYTIETYHFPELAYCDESGTGTEVGFGSTWAATLTCKKSASKESEDFMDMMDPMDAPTVAYCFTDAGHNLDVPMYIQHTSARGSLQVSCYFGNHECVGDLAGTQLSIHGIAINTPKIVSPVDPADVMPMKKCSDFNNGTAGSGRRLLAEKPAGYEDYPESPGYGSPATPPPEEVHYWKAGEGGESVLFAGFVSVYEKYKGRVKEGKFQYFWMGGNITKVDDPKTVAGYNVLTPFEYSFEFPEKEEKYSYRLA